jgi:signal transduction histidine kinase
LQTIQATIDQTEVVGVHRHDPLYCELTVALAEANDVVSGMHVVADRVRRESGAAGVEWWGAGSEPLLTRLVVSGSAHGERGTVSLGSAGSLVIHGGRVEAELEATLKALAPLVRRRANEERLAHAASALARRNEALAEYAALVAHELKSPLQAALYADRPQAPLEEALDLVDGLLAAARTAPAGQAATEVGECLERATAAIRNELVVTRKLGPAVPLPAEQLTVILRNLLSNAASAGASTVQVSSELSYRALRLLVEDDGVGLFAADSYASGSGLGLELCRQIAARFGGTLELSARAAGGTCATLTFPAPR